MKKTKNNKFGGGYILEGGGIIFFLFVKVFP